MRVSRLGWASALCVYSGLLQAQPPVAEAAPAAELATIPVRVPEDEDSGTQLEQIEVTADGSRLVMYLDDGTEVRFGEARDLFTKLVRLETVLLTNPEREPGTIDVSTSQTTL